MTPDDLEDIVQDDLSDSIVVSKEEFDHLIETFKLEE